MSITKFLFFGCRTTTSFVRISKKSQSYFLLKIQKGTVVSLQHTQCISYLPHDHCDGKYWAHDHRDEERHIWPSYPRLVCGLAWRWGQLRPSFVHSYVSLCQFRKFDDSHCFIQRGVVKERTWHSLLFDDGVRLVDEQFTFWRYCNSNFFIQRRPQMTTCLEVTLSLQLRQGVCTDEYF